jgi:SAM-dependent methyltransferase
MSNENVYDRIAPGWYNHRHRTIFRPELEALAQKWQKGRLLNIGCGHGADFLPFKDGFELYGIDLSAGMLAYARKYAEKYRFKVNLAQADACHLPFPDDSFDWTIAVATYHHLKTREDRKNAFLELKRVLKPGGQAFITVWNRWQPRFRFFQREAMVPWRTGDETLYRYYYLFTYSELERLAKYAGFSIIRSFPEAGYRAPVKWFSRNVCLVVKKGK